MPGDGRARPKSPSLFAEWLGIGWKRNSQPNRTAKSHCSPRNVSIAMIKSMPPPGTHLTQGPKHTEVPSGTLCPWTSASGANQQPAMPQSARLRILASKQRHSTLLADRSHILPQQRPLTYFTSRCSFANAQSDVEQLEDMVALVHYYSEFLERSCCLRTMLPLQ